MTDLLMSLRVDVALFDVAGAVTGQQLRDRVACLAGGLAAAGVVTGDRVVVQAGNRREFFETVLACLYAGFTAVPVNAHLTDAELTYIRQDCAAAAVVLDNDLPPTPAAASEARPGTVFTIGTASYEDLFTQGPRPEAEQAGGWLFYTSGTTGHPKGVRHRRGEELDLASQAQGFCQGLGIPADGVTLLCGPAYHGAQLAFALWPLLTGSRVVMRRRFNATETLLALRDHQVTNVHLVPTQLVRMLALDEQVRSALTPVHLVTAYHGAAPCAPDVKRRMIDWWGPKLVEYYGATEGGFFAVATSHEWLERPGTVGRSFGNWDVIAVDEEGTPLARGETGQLYIRAVDGSDFEYHNDPQKTAGAHHPSGMFSVGDVGRVDGDGYVFLSDRKIDMVISGGVNIYPAEIEAVLMEHPDVIDAAVIGVPNPEFGEEVKALIEPRAAADLSALEDSLTTWCRARLAGFKLPRSFELVESLPRTPMGKLNKRILRAPYWENADRAI